MRNNQTIGQTIGIFCWSGVISDNTRTIFNTVNAILFSRNKKIFFGFQEFKKKNTKNFSEFWKEYDIDYEKDKIRDEFIEIYKSESSHTKIFPFAKDALEKISKKIPYLGICSTHANVSLIDEFTKANVLQYFHEPFIAGGVNDKELYLKKFSSTYSSNKIFFVSDMADDITSGKEAGIITVALLSGCNVESELKAVRPDYLINDISEMDQVLDQIS